MPATGFVDVTCELASGDVRPVALPYTCHLPEAGAPSGVGIVYLHGGGLLFGSRDDLPAPRRADILARGHALWCLDYPLAPEVTAPAIIDAAAQAVEALVHGELAAHGCTKLVLFGRSAGAYLALMVAARLAHTPAAPAAVLDFYGYYDLTAPFVAEPSRHYQKLPAVAETTVASILRRSRGDVLTSAGELERYGLYVYARQTGRWTDLMGLTPDTVAAASLGPGDIAQLPPTFIAASTGDEDVPYRVSKTLSRLAPTARLYTAYYLEHDFDRDTTHSEGAEAYAAALDFIDAALA